MALFRRRRIARADIALVALVLLTLAAFALLGGGRAVATKRCAPVVTRAGATKLSKAFVLIVEGRTDCEKSRKAIYEALSGTPIEDRQIEGWTCSSTERAGPAEPYGARCSKDGSEPAMVRSTLPHKCPGCRRPRD